MLNLNVNHAIRQIKYANHNMETLGDRIRHQRGVKGLSQAALAAKLDVTKGAVSQWENGSTANIKLATFLKLCDILGASAEYLIHGPQQRGPGGGGKRLPAARRNDDPQS